MLAVVLLLVSYVLNPLGARPVSVEFDGVYAWSMSDRITGAVTGSVNQESAIFTTESMIKPWLAADYLRRFYATTGVPPPYRMRQLAFMLDLSDDEAAQDVYADDGGNAAVERMITVCGLTDTTVHPYWWSLTTMSASDARRLGLCIADGRAAGRWTSWLINEMTHVEGGVSDQQARRGGGRWGIIDALTPPDQVITSIKNGWTDHADGWHVNCLAVHRFFVLSVMARYPSRRGLAYGAELCTSITKQLVKPSIL